MDCPREGSHPGLRRRGVAPFAQQNECPVDGVAGLDQLDGRVEEALAWSTAMSRRSTVASCNTAPTASGRSMLRLRPRARERPAFRSTERWRRSARAGGWAAALARGWCGHHPAIAVDSSADFSSHPMHPSDVRARWQPRARVTARGRSSRTGRGRARTSRSAVWIPAGGGAGVGDPDTGIVVTR